MMMNFTEAARFTLLGCEGMTAEAADKIMADCKMAVDMKDPFGFLEDAQRAGQRHGMGYSVFSDFNTVEGKLMLSMALRSAAMVKDPIVTPAAEKQADVPIELPIPVAPMPLSVPSAPSKFEVFSINEGKMLDFDADTLDKAIAKAKKVKAPCAIYSNSALVASYSPARGVTKHV
jgi:hypothetical protein